MTDETLILSFDRLLQEHCTSAKVRAIEAGAGLDDLWRHLDEAGYMNALVPEAQGGAGLSLKDVSSLLVLCGRYAVPSILPQTMMARALLALQVKEVPEGPLDLSEFDSGNLIGAVLAAAQMAGAMERVFEMTVAFANERTQFGRAIGKFQALQQQISVMAEQVYAAKMAAEMGCQMDILKPDLMRAGIAKSRTSEACVQVCAIAHAVHGAIGATEELDLQLFTRRLHGWRAVYGAETYWNRLIGAAVLGSSPRSSNEMILDHINF